MRKDYTVYRHRNRVTNEVFYVGSGSINRGQERYKGRHCEKWNSIYEEFGKPIVEIVARDLSRDDALDLEYLMIDTYGTVLDEDGPLVNIKRDRYKAHWTTKEKMTKSQSGRKHSEETKEVIRKSALGEKNGMFGKPMRQNTKAALLFLYYI